MSENKPKRLSALAREYNVGIPTIINFLKGKGLEVKNDPNEKVPFEYLDLIDQHFKDSKTLKEKAIQNTEKIKIPKEQKVEVPEKTSSPEVKPVEPVKEIKPVVTSPVVEKEPEKQIPEKVEAPKIEEPEVTDAEISVKDAELPQTEIQESIQQEQENTSSEQITGPKVIGKVDLSSINERTRPKKKTKEEKLAEHQKLKAKPVEAFRKEDKPTEEIQTEKTSEMEYSQQEIVASEDKIESTVQPETSQEEQKQEPEFIETKVEKLTGPNVVGKINLDSFIKQQEESEKRKKQLKEERQKQREKEKEQIKAKRKRIKKLKIDIEKDLEFETKKKKPIKKPIKVKKPEIDEEEVQKQVKETLARLTTPKQKSKAAKYRREKRELFSQRRQEEMEKTEAEKKILKVTEFVSVNELATMMDVPVTNVIASCMSLGLFVSINQRLDAETMAIVADEYGYSVEFVSAEVLNEIEEEPDNPEDLIPRPPIVTVMGHVDHGKTKLLDRIRNTNVAEGEAGGITQHIGAYSVTLEDGRKITFLDTPGHEAFTAMRARGAQITDVAIIVIAADDNIMPQTVEAINHASAAGVPIVFAINKIDLPTANPDKIREALANMNYLVEDWGGKYQCQEISAKAGINVDLLLEKVLLEAELLELKANPNKKASGTVIESSLDKGRGYVATLIVQNGTLKVGDVVLAGCQTGRVKAMYNERGQKLESAGPSTPVQILGLNGAPMAGDKFNVMDSDHEARTLANKRQQLLREQELRTKKHITLDEIGRRLALGNFNEINVIVKGDVDGSVEALSDALIKLSTEKCAVNIIHKAVGQISESDVMLAAASNAVIVGFQVRPSSYARKLAEKEQIEIRLYSIIYDAINDMKDAMEGMLSPEIKENITGSAEVREIFKISKVGTVAGCLVTEGRIYRKSKVRVIRDGIVIYTGDLGSLKRFKDDAKEVIAGQECGLNIDKFNDIKVGDIVEAFEEVEVKQTL